MTSAKYRFFCNNPSAGILSEDESGHAIRVLRLEVGNTIELIDGCGGRYIATISEITKKTLHFQTIEKIVVPLTTRNIHIAIAPTKNIDRFEFFLEKCTEIGISKITPLLTKNSERKEIKLEKLQKNLIAAVKQSGQLFLPELTPLTTFKQFLTEKYDNETQRFIAHCESDQDKIQLFDKSDPSKNVVILIGPEGDFSSDEINLAKEAGFEPVSLGDSRLRTETAGIAACLTVHLKK